MNADTPVDFSSLVETPEPDYATLCRALEPALYHTLSEEH
jgi:hypothetical protein